MDKKLSNTGVSLAPVISECERILREAVAHFGLKTDPEAIVVTIQTKGRRNALGWFWAGRWKHQKNSVHEINLSAEHLASCNQGELLIHELAHAENHTLGIHDCSGKAHNKHFKTMAERLGLLVKPRDKRYGYGFTDLDKPASDFLAKVKFNTSVFDLARFSEGTLATKVGSRLLKAECPDCGYTIRVTRKWADVGMPKCPCGSHMEEA